MLKSTASLRSFQISCILPFTKTKSPFISSLYLTKPIFSYSVDPRQGRGPSNFRPNQPPQQPQSPPNRPRGGLKKPLLILLAGLSGFGLSYYQYGAPEQKPVEKPKSASDPQTVGIAPPPSGKSLIGGPWRLLDTKGELVTEKDFEGKYYLLYFGFCFCPDICPETMTKLSKALDILKKDPSFPADQLKTVFVSVDPDRDTPERLEKFLSRFGDDIVGVRGISNDDPHLKDMLKKYRILVSKITLDGTHNAETVGNSYTMDHTTIAYLMDKNNKCAEIFVPTMTANTVADLLKKKIENKA